MLRKHTTTACQTCRSSKIKCDGVRPSCGSCAKRGKWCEYSAQDDKRKISWKTAIEVLLDRVDELTQLALSNGLAVPAWKSSAQPILEQLSDSFKIPREEIAPSLHSQPSSVSQLPLNQLNESEPPASMSSYNDMSLMSQVPDSSQIYQATDITLTSDWTDFSASEGWDFSPSDWSWQILSGFPATFPDNGASAREPIPVGDDQITALRRNEAQGEIPESSGSSDDEGETDIVPSLAARLGFLRVATDGRLRYYGTASNYHLLPDNNDLRESDNAIQDTTHEARTALEHACLDREVPEALEDELLRLFFAWHNPCHLTIDKDVFDAARAKDRNGQSAFCSPSLVTAMCAIGAAFEGRYHHSFVTFPQSLADYFAAKSKILLEIELDSPSVSAVQSLLLLSSHEAAAGRDARMWLYSGMAMRLSFDLGLHVDNDPYIKQGVFTVQEAVARSSTFWSCVVVNHLWGFSLGRPFRVDSEEVTVKRVGSPQTGISQTGERSTYLVAEQWVSFTEELAPLFRILYGCAKISKTSLRELCAQTTNRLLSWHDSIPEEIQIRPHEVARPHVLLLHMGYHNFCILVHRPWTSKASQPRGQIGPGYQHARTVCRKSASAVASLLRDYEKHYSLRSMNVYVVTIIFSVSIILIFAMIGENNPQSGQSEDDKLKIMADLNICFRALDELCQSFECAKRTRDHLFSIQKRWTQSKRDHRLELKRSGVEQTQQHQSQKRKKGHSA